MGLSESEIWEWIKAQYPESAWDTMYKVYSMDNERFPIESRNDYLKWKETEA